MRKEIGDKARLCHILDAINEINSYIENVEFETFINDSKTKFTSIKQIEIIGEAANHISDETKRKFQNIEWQKITGLRNILVNEYFGVDENILWTIIVNDIPDLKKSIENTIRDLSN